MGVNPSSAHSRPRLRGGRLQRESRAAIAKQASWIPAFAGMSGCRRSLHRAPDGVGEIGLFPGEAAVLVGRAAEMAVGRGAPVDRAAELEGAADIDRKSVAEGKLVK